MARQSSLIDLNSVRIFLHVAEQNSFIRASEALGLPKATVSAKIAMLERDLGVRLFQRSTRRVSLTEAGGRLYVHCRRAADALNDAIAAVSHLRDGPRGTLRVAAPVLFAQRILAPALPRLLERFPDLTLDIEAVNTLPELIQGRFDAGIGVGACKQPGCVTRKLLDFSQALFASPTYLARRGSPSDVAHLAGHRLLVSWNEGSRRTAWNLMDGSNHQRIEVNEPGIRINDIVAVHGLTLSGAGIALLPDRLCDEDMQSGRLVRILPGWISSPVSIYVCYPSRKLVPAKVRTFIDFLLEILQVPVPSRSMRRIT